MLIFNNNKFELISQKSFSTTIILLNWNSLEFLKNCLRLIEKNTSLPYSIIIVDNGSTDDSIEYLSTLKHQTILLKENTGFPKGMNTGILHANKNDNIVLLNVDAEPQHGWLEEIYNTYKKFNKIGLIGPLGNNLPSQYQAINSVSQDTQVFILMFYCVFISRELINKIGLLDERYGLGGYDDNDFSYRSVLAGFNNFISAKSRVLHEPHQVTKLNGLSADLYKNNENIFHEKFHAILTNISLQQDLFVGGFAKKTGLYC